MPTETETAKRGFSPAEAAHYAGRSRSAVYLAIRDGSLRSAKVGGSRLILREWLDQWLDQLVEERAS